MSDEDLLVIEKAKELAKHTGDIMRCVHEERIDVEFVKISADIKRVLKDWCKDHDGEFFAVLESRCVVKE